MLTYKAALLAGALAVSSSAMAQNLQIGPNGVRVDRDRAERNYRPDREMRGDMIDRREAITIARRQGVEQVDRVRESRGSWTIDGQDRRGDDIIVRVSLRGEVLDVRRE
jgi:hypothetical protein